ncbi:MAG: phosphoribosylanthranilate isomerase [Lachnospiraceae bacterium]|nr:phosphoribosylanthranilate isomerase [Lachnospiraceae bacterium]
MLSRVKICGLKTEADIEMVNELKPDFVGFIINFPKSHRSKTEQEVKILREKLRKDIKAVGVFVNEPEENVVRMLKEGTIDLAQLHGDETDDMILRIKRNTNQPVIKAYCLRDKEDFATALASPADYILLDQGKGEGRTFDWSLIDEEIQRPWFLAGGLGPENLKEAITRLHPWAVDLSSSVETDQKKDFQKVKEVIHIVREPS